VIEVSFTSVRAIGAIDRVPPAIAGGGNLLTLSCNVRVGAHKDHHVQVECGRYGGRCWGNWTGSLACFDAVITAGAQQCNTTSAKLGELVADDFGIRVRTPLSVVSVGGADDLRDVLQPSQV